jgi:hypothetical protein
MISPHRFLFLCVALLCPVALLFGNGGAWQVGLPLTGNAAPSDKARTTNVAIEEENLTIDLHQEFAAVEVRYRMHNTGGAVTQDFFFPVERWTAEEGDESEGGKPADLEDYKIVADKTELKVKTIDVKTTPTPTPSPTPEPANAEVSESTETNESDETDEGPAPGHYMDDWDFPPPSKHWKKSEIPFTANQTREITIRYRVGYSARERSVSDDSHGSEREFVYSLSPAATWKGSIGQGKIVVNILHPRPEEVAIRKPQDRFKKVNDTRYEWSFANLEPTLADDLLIVAHPAYDSYSAHNSGPIDEGTEPPIADYIIQDDHYFLQHADYEASATSTLPPSGKHTYDASKLKSLEGDVAWAEGVDGDGIGESVTLQVNRPLPLDAILIVPGYRSLETPALWTKNNRVAELEVTLNGDHTFTAKIPNEKFAEFYPIPVRDYAEPVKTVKLMIKAVHRGASARDTCISAVQLKGKLATKPEIHPAR